MSVFDRHGWQSRGLARRTQEVAGAVQPPRISIMGNRFALIDGNGDRYEWPALTIDVAIVDVNPNASRMYWANTFTPGDDGTPPDCWSDNGVAPSARAAAPQSETCASCPHSAWDQVSNFTGKSKPACSTKNKLAVIVLNDENPMPYMFAVPVMSMKRLKKYAGEVQTYKCPGTERAADLEDVITRVSFVPGKQGELEFAALGWISSIYKDGGFYINCAYPGQPVGQNNPPVPSPDGGEEFAHYVDVLVQSKATEWLVGANDQPRVAQIAGPQAGQGQLTGPQQAGQPTGLRPVSVQQAAPVSATAALGPAPQAQAQSQEPAGPPTGHGGRRQGAGRPRGAGSRKPDAGVVVGGPFPSSPSPLPSSPLAGGAAASPSQDSPVPIRMGGAGDPAALGAVPKTVDEAIEKRMAAARAAPAAEISGDGLPDYLRRQQPQPQGGAAFQNPTPASDELTAALGKALALNTKR